MKIIGHRGAAGLALENTLAGIELACLLGVDAIEVDVRMTKDEKLVLCHDSDLRRVSSSSAKVSEHTYEELSKIVLNDGESTVPLLRDAIKTADKTPVILELKASGMLEELHKILDDFADRDITVISFKLDEIIKLRSQNPDLNLYGSEHTKPFEIIHWARLAKLNGVVLNFWLLNPLTYFLIKRHNLKIFAFTVDNRFIVRFFGRLYPDVGICTNHPEYFIKNSWTKLRKIRGQQERNKGIRPADS